MIGKLTKSEQKEAQRLFLQYQEEYNKTHNPEILWFKMEPLIKRALESAIKKVNKNNFVQDFDDKVADADTLLMKRYIKNPNYNFRSLPTLCYWAAIWACRRPEVVFYESKIDNITELQERKKGEEDDFITRVLGDKTDSGRED